MGTIFEIQRFCIHDGPGIRTTVFFKGCPLSCLWCHNPEGLSFRQELACNADKCIRCHRCTAVCPSGACTITERGISVDRSLCTACFKCTGVCPGGALSKIGREVSAEEVLEEVLKDSPFYETSGGGMTLSGGEPLAQADFALDLLAKAKASGLHCCVETSGYCRWETLDAVAPYIDLFLFDIKCLSEERHRRLTGVGNSAILENLRRLHREGCGIRLRIPLIPGCNDGEDDLMALVELRRELPNLRGIDIMPYHAMGEHKARQLGAAPSEVCAPDGRPAAPPPAEIITRWRKALTN